MMQKKKSAYEIVRAARSGERTAKDFIDGMITDFFELHGDRRFGDDQAILAGIGMLHDLPLTVIGIEKGHTLKERKLRNFGSPHPEGYRKALRLMKQAEKFHRPILCLIDTSGAYCGIGAEERGQGQAIAENLYEMMTLNTPIISIDIGEGGSGGALALGVADRVYMLKNSVYSVISPEGCASILWKDGKRAAEAAESLKLTPADARRLRVVEEVLDEKAENFMTVLSEKLYREFQALRQENALLEKRYLRFRRCGTQ